VACWAHARRKIYEVAVATGSAIARQALQHIATLFAIEAGINRRRPEERLAVRQQEAVPRLAVLKTFLDAALTWISGKSSLAQAIRYALSRWQALLRYTTDGRLEMTNAAAERAIRPLVASLTTQSIGSSNYCRGTGRRSPTTVCTQPPADQRKLVVTGVTGRLRLNGPNRFKELRRRGVPKFHAAVAASSPTGFWRMSGHPAVQQTLRNGLGLLRLYVPAHA
jgi:hypothetical protein